jgi:aryl-alcohol dehydrogenase-like predicted oxidoreductase
MAATETGNRNSRMIYRPLGRSGENVSVLGLGGSHIGKAKLSEKKAIHIIRAALDAGISFMDNSWDYNHGESERRLGKALKDGYRNRAFVMTKIDGRSKKAARQQFDESLLRMKLESVDLLQHHEIIRYEDVDRIFAEGGAMEAFVEARQQGKLRYIGFTGHKDPHVHLYMLEQARRHGVTFDTVQMPLNPMDWHFRSFEKHVLPVLVEQGIGVLGMKSLGSGILLKSGAVTAPECLRYAMSLPASTVITGIDSMEILNQALDAARNFNPMTDEEMHELRERAASSGANGEYELFKTTTLFDSTTEHPDWMGEESERARQLAAG